MSQTSLSKGLLPLELVPHCGMDLGSSHSLYLCARCVLPQRDDPSWASVRLLTLSAQLGYGDPSAQFCSVSRSSWRKLSALTNCCYLVPVLPRQVF